MPGIPPGVLTFLRWVSYDVRLFWAPQVVSSASAFLEYLQFADVDLHIYMECCPAGVRIRDIIPPRLRRVTVQRVCEAGGNLIIACMKGDPQPEITAEHDLEIFDNLAHSTPECSLLFGLRKAGMTVRHPRNWLHFIHHV